MLAVYRAREPRAVVVVAGALGVPAKYYQPLGAALALIVVVQPYAMFYSLAAARWPGLAPRAAHAREPL